MSSKAGDYQTPYGMELLSTVHKMGTSLERGCGDINEVASKMLSLEKNKRNIFPEDEIHVAFMRLREDSLI